LDRIHEVRLLRKNRIAQRLRPIELRTHHLEDFRRCGQGFDAAVPWLLINRRLQLISL